MDNENNVQTDLADGEVAVPVVSVEAQALAPIKVVGEGEVVYVQTDELTGGEEVKADEAPTVH